MQANDKELQQFHPGDWGFGPEVEKQDEPQNEKAAEQRQEIKRCQIEATSPGAHGIEAPKLRGPLCIIAFNSAFESL